MNRSASQDGVSAPAMQTNSFAELIREVRRGNERAAETLMRLYEPQVRRAIRIRMRDRSLRQFLDSVDISQSVMANFFNHLQSGDFTIHSPAQMIALLVRMAQNRVTDWVRYGQSQRHDYRRQVPLNEKSMDEASVAQCGPSHSTPLDQLESEEIMRHVRDRLAPRDREVLDRRIERHSWASIADDSGVSVESIRSRFRRAMRQVAIELGLVDIGD